ncbi:MAG: alpha/beta fold hydrolase [Planctomycetaceae bacterium]
MRGAVIIVVVALGFVATGRPGGGGVDAAEGGSSRRVIDVPAADGIVTWEAVAVAIAESSELDGAALRGALPHGRIDLNSATVRWSLRGLNTVLPKGVSVLPRRSGDERSLRILFDRRALVTALGLDPSSVSRPRTAAVTQPIASDVAQACRLELDADWRKRTTDRPLVVLVHGYNSSAGQLRPLHELLRHEGFACAMYSYPNDGSIDAAAVELSGELRRLRTDSPATDVAIVAHSMGGLVSRAAVEDAERDPGNVRRLILVATPNQGSNLARLPIGLDLWEHLVRRDGDRETEFLQRIVADGLEEGRHDMRPGSPFLNALNARKRNPRIEYTLLIGDEAVLTDEQRAELCERWEELCQSSRTARLVSPRIDPILSGDELRTGRGDGAVSLASARLEGVEDIEILHFRHNAITEVDESEAGRLLGAEIVRRLTDAPGN